jgi:hypothetical protein
MAFCSECGKQLNAGSGFCPACGTPTQGEAAPAVPVTAVPVPAVPVPAASAMPAAPVSAVPAVPAAVPASAPNAEPAASPDPGFGRRVRVFFPIGVGAVVLLIVVIMLVKGLGGASGGAGSPTAAVRQLASAAQAEDPAAAIAVIDPGEARTLAAVYRKVRDALRPAGVVQPTGAVTGTHVAIQGLQLNEEQLSSDVAKVTITGGTLSAAVKAAALPVVFGVNGDSGSTTDLGSARGPGGAGLFLMTRKQEGRWYISPTLTVLQYIVELHGLAQPDFSTLESRSEAGGGASSPGQLASELAQAVSASDVSGVLNLASDREASAVRPYSAALQELVGRAGGSLQAQVSAPQFTETQLGSGLVRLNLIHAGFNLAIDGEESSQTIDGTFNGPCLSASTTTDTGTSDSNHCFSRIHSLLGVDNYFVVAEHAAGGLRLAPIATVLEYARLFVNQLGGAGIRRLLGAVTQEAPSGELASSSRASGHLNAAGYAVLAYHAPKPGLLALYSDQWTAIIEPGGRAAQPLACDAESELFQLRSAGDYRVLLAAPSYQAVPYHVSAEPVTAREVNVPSRISGSVGAAGQMAVLAFDLPPSGASFQSASPVQSSIVGPEGSDNNSCAPVQGELGEMFGSRALIHPHNNEPINYSLTGLASSQSSATAPGRYYLVISGAPGARFSGSLSPQPQESEGG